MKNILLALASFIVTFAFLFQVANAQEVDGWPPRTAANPPASGDNKADVDTSSGPNKLEANANEISINCDSGVCTKQTVKMERSVKNTNPSTSGGKAGSSSDTGSSKQGGTK